MKKKKRKCIERNELLPLTSDVFFQPIPKFNQDRPLTDCVLTISGIEQCERENITKLCEALGAHVQKSLSSKVTGGFRQNTHLICREPLGPKYEAAKSWRIPIVYPEWVIECCVTGVLVEESKFCVQSGHNAAVATQLIDVLGRIRTNAADECANSTTVSGADAEQSGGYRDVTVDKSDETSVLSNLQKSGLNDSSLSASKNEAKKPRLDAVEYQQGTCFKITHNIFPQPLYLIEFRKFYFKNCKKK